MANRIGVVVVLLGLAACHHDGNVLSEDMSVAAFDAGCFAGGAACTGDGQCCGGSCDTTGHCAAGACMPTGAACTLPTECCSFDCANGSCSGSQCVSDGQACTAGGAECCSTMCVGGACKPLNTTCKTAGNACPSGNGDCCSGLCTGGLCATPSEVSYCTQTGDICFHDGDCCTGVCDGASGTTAGTCATVASSCRVDGLTCDGCTGCCSSYCAPFGTVGSKICQPASGCHVLGDLCHTDGDCCGGAAASGLPGAGLVKCVADPTHPQIGTCSMANPNNCPDKEATCKNTCQPEGDVCHFLGNGGCSSNSFPANCCGAPGASKGVCKLDTLGVPRCYGLTACVMENMTCASSADCCNAMPCVPNASGDLVCAPVSCEPTGSVCTTTADCCTGIECIVPPGSLEGSCSKPTAPPPQNDGGTVDLAGPLCALYGQSCSTSVSCCAGSSCLRAPADGGGSCAAGDTDCVCYTLIQ